MNIKKLIYIEENFLNSDECKTFIDYVDANQKENKEDFFRQVVDKVTAVCKSFDERANLDYVGVARWPVGTFMKPHFDTNTGHKENILAAMLYLNNDFDGGNLIFKDLTVKPDTGKLIIFSNTENLHYVNRVDKSERYVLSFWYTKP